MGVGVMDSAVLPAAAHLVEREGVRGQSQARPSAVPAGAPGRAQTAKSRPRRDRAAPTADAAGTDHTWSIDFVFDASANGKPPHGGRRLHQGIDRDCRGTPDQRIGRRRPARCSVPFPRLPIHHPHRSGAGVHGSRARPMGACQWRQADADPAGQADAERLHRKLQRAVPRRMPLRAPVRHARASQGADRRMAA